MDTQLSKGPKEDTGFFEKNGTLQQMNTVANSLRMAQSNSGVDRAQGLGQIIAMIASLFA